MNDERTSFFISASAAIILVACGNTAPSSPAHDDTTTSGNVLVLADEQLKPIVDAEAFIFLNQYPDARLELRYLPEARLLKAMLNDSVRCVVTTAMPGGEQEAFFSARKLEAESVPICTDAIAVVVNKACRLDRSSVPWLKSLLQKGADSGTRSGWSAVIAGSESGTARTLVDSLQLDAGVLSAKAGVDVRSVIASVERDPSRLGLVPFAAISDLDDPEMKGLRERVKLLPIARSDTSRAFLPTQGTLADGSYPLRRQVYMVLTEAKSGLGTGFVSFVANHKGQRILLKSGLAPHKVPAREVEIVHQ